MAACLGRAISGDAGVRIGLAELTEPLTQFDSRWGFRDPQDFAARIRQRNKKGFTLPGWWLSPKLASESGPS